MKSAQKSACHKIIHTAAAASAAGNLVPVPGTGFAADLGAMITMVMALARVFKLDGSEGGAESKKRAKKKIMFAATKNIVKKQLPGSWKKHVAKESAKIISKEVAREIAITALKKQIAAQPVRYVSKELLKFVPGLGNALSSVISAGLMEAAGWRIAADFDRRARGLA